MKLRLDKIKLFAFDLDGTLYLGDQAIAGAVELIEFLRTKYQVVFFTNNSSKSAENIALKLRRLGFKCEPQEVYTSTTAASSYLIENQLDDLYAIGSGDLEEVLRQAGLSLVGVERARHLVVGLDLDFNYQKIADAMIVLGRERSKFIACNVDRAYPVSGGILMPGTGAMVGAIAEASGRQPDYIVGKPNTYLLQKISAAYKVKNDEIMVVGDSLESDIMMAKNFRCQSILIDGQRRVSDLLDELAGGE